jgi:hypothetical protein
MSSRHFLYAIALAVGVLGVSQAQAQTISNGSFEQGSAASPFSTYGVGGDIPGWYVYFGNVDQVRFWQSAKGSMSLDMKGNAGQAGIVQTLNNLVNNTLYAVSFALSANPGYAIGGTPTATATSADRFRHLNISVNGANGDIYNPGASFGNQTFSVDTVGKTFENMGWQDQTFYFNYTGITGGSAYLYFRSLATDTPTADFTQTAQGINTSSSGAALDDVRIQAVPVPVAGAGLPLLAGFIGYTAWRRRRPQGALAA